MMFNMEVSSYHDAMKLEDQYFLKWYCNGQPVKRAVKIITDNLMQAKDPKEMVRSYVRGALETGVIDLHADDHCAWCFAAKHALEIIFKNDDIGAPPPTPFWKQKHPVISSGQVFIGKPGGPDTEWQELGYTSVDGIQFGPKYHSGGAIEAENGTFGSLTSDILSASETMKKMQQQIHYTSQMMGGWNHPNNPAADIYAETAAQREARMLAQRSNELPGASIKVKYPCADNCSLGQFYNDEGGRSIRSIIMHLNDVHKWTREAIADWLDSVDDPESGIDLAFKVPEKEEE